MIMFILESLLTTFFYLQKMFFASSQKELVWLAVKAISSLGGFPLLNAICYMYIMFYISDQYELMDISFYCSIDVLPLPDFLKPFLYKLLKYIYDFRR